MWVWNFEASKYAEMRPKENDPRGEYKMCNGRCVEMRLSETYSGSVVKKVERKICWEYVCSEKTAAVID